MNALQLIVVLLRTILITLILILIFKFKILDHFRVLTKRIYIVIRDKVRKRRKKEVE
jgi:hypothetical protein